MVGFKIGRSGLATMSEGPEDVPLILQRQGTRRNSWMLRLQGWHKASKVD